MAPPAYAIPTTKYQLSGSIGASPVAFALITVPLLILLGLVYAYICVYIPIAGYVTLLILAGYCFAVAVVVGGVIKLGKCRNLLATKLYGLIGGAVALYAAWSFFVSALVNRGEHESVSGFALLLDPARLWSLISEINRTGWYSLHSLTPSGWVLTIFWVIEAIALLGSAYLAAACALDNELYCEQCGAWCDVSDTRFYSAEKSELESKINDISIETLPVLKPLAEKILPCFQGEILTCAKCKQFSGFRLSRLSETTNDEGKKSGKKETVDGVLVN